MLWGLESKGKIHGHTKNQFAQGIKPLRKEHGFVNKGLYSGSSQLGMTVPHREHLVMSKRLERFSVVTTRGEELIASSG